MKSARSGWILALVVAALAVGWWAMRARSHAPIVTPSTKHAEPAPVAVELAEPSPETTSAARSTAAADTVTITPRPESPDDWVVLVVDASTKAPVAGAQVTWSDKSPLPRDPRRPLVMLDRESTIAADALWVETDARGVVRLPSDALPGSVYARHGAAFGSTGVLERREAKVQVWLRNALHLDIQVVDAAGSPVAGVPVSLRAADSVQGAQPIWTGITAGELGIARARHFESGLARLKPPFDLVAGFEFPTRTAPTVPVDVEHLPLEPLRLVLPPSGSVEVVVHDASGGPVRSMGMEVNLNVTTPGEADFFVTPNLRQFQPASVENGRALYPFVETGLELSVQVIVNMAFLPTKGPGPRANGERVTFDIDAGPPKPWLVGRLVDEAGLPISNADVQCGIQIQSGGGGSFPVKTDAQARFEITSFVPTQASPKATLSFRPYGRAATSGGVGSLSLDAPLHDGENDLGDIVVRMPLVLATGRVVDEHDAPVASPLLGVEIEGTGSGSSIWGSDAETTVKCEETGAFKVVSTSTHAQLRISVRKTGYVQLEPCQVAGGARDVKVTIWKAGEISGSVIVEPDIALTEISVFARAQSEPERKWSQAPMNECVHVRADGTFSLVDIRPLVFDLTVRRSGMKEPLIVVPNLDLRGGGAAKDPRLSGIDLRGLVRNAHDERKPVSPPR